jgi:hypothetical protein
MWFPSLRVARERDCPPAVDERGSTPERPWAISVSGMYRICSADLPGRPNDAVTPSELAGLAVDERVDNTHILPWTGGGFGVMRAVIERRKLWQPGRTLRIKFVGGEESVRNRVRAVAELWLNYVNIHFDWVRDGDPAEIRISFADDGSWSYIGTDALGVAHSNATMNYGWLEVGTPQEEYERVVLHEFGHMLGMHHEHMSPSATIPWDVDAVYAYYARMGWSKNDVDWNVLMKLETSDTNFTHFDRESIMLYSIPNSLTIGDYEVGWNRTLSTQDIAFMRSQYPGREPVLPELTLNGDALSVDLAAANEVDTFRFLVPEPVVVIATTTGPLDTVLTVLGPDDPGAVVTWDDDRGRAENARIVKKLVPGNYWLTVRHGERAEPGPYKVQVRTRKSATRSG